MERQTKRELVLKAAKRAFDRSSEEGEKEDLQSLTDVLAAKDELTSVSDALGEERR